MPESPSPATVAVRPRRPPIIWLAPILALLALTSWAFASPVGSSPDDDFHLASIWCAAGDRTSLCEESETVGSRDISKALLGAACFARDSTLSGACQAAVFEDTRLVESNRGNFAGGYPPVYYGVMSLFATDDIQTSVLVMRMVNVVLFVGMLTALTVLLPIRHRRTLLWSWLITVIPLGLFLIASINPSAWALIGVGTAWMALLGFFDTSGRQRIGLAAVFVVASIMAVGSRADAAIYLALAIVAVVFLRFRRDRKLLSSWILPAVGLVLAILALLISQQVGIAVGGFDSTDPSPTDTSAPVDPGASAPPAGSTLGLVFSNLVNAPSLWAGVFGSWSLGWFDTPMPFVVALGGVGVFAAVTFTGIAVISWRKALITAAVAAALWVIPVYILTRGGQMVGVELQPRYLLPLIVVLAGFALLAVASREFRLTRLQRILVVATSIGTQSLALFYTMRRFITGEDVNGFDLGADAEWWWTGVPGPMLFWIVGSLCWAGLVLLVVRFIEHPAPPVAEVEPVPTGEPAQ
jgi:hypothetical protein